MIGTMNQNHSVSRKEHNRLESYIKFFAFKCIQTIVQSRTCIKSKSRSKASSGNYDWFNVAIEDEPSIQDIAEKALASQSLVSNFSLCIEIQLQTSDKDKLILETWCLSMSEQGDNSVSVSSVYPCLCVLLKSVIAVSRVTPAYKISSQQSPETYIILYRLYFGPPQIHVLGEGCQENKIGEVRTPVGILKMSLAFRTKMTITPQKIDADSPFMVRSNYFEPDMSPKRIQTSPIPNGFHPMANHGEKKRSPSEGLFNCGDAKSNQHYTKCPLQFAESEVEYGRNQNGVSNSDFKEGYQVTGAFAPSTKFPDPSLCPELMLPDRPLLFLPSSSTKSLLKGADDNANINSQNVDNKVVLQEDVDYNCNTSEEGLAKMSSSGHSDCDDFVMVDMRPPFADSDSGSDLGAFFRECQCAPPLASFAAQPSLEEQVIDITNQLAQFETSMHDFDTFVDSICQVEAKK